MREYLDSDNNPERSRIPVGSILETAEKTVKKKKRADELDISNGGTVSPESKKWANEQNTYPPPTPFDEACDLDCQIDKCQQELQSLKFRKTAVETAISECASNFFSLDPSCDPIARAMLEEENKTFTTQSKKSRKPKKSYQTIMSQGTAPGSQYSNGTAIGSQQSGASYYP